MHPIWRGIGFLLLILVPFIAYGLADLLLAALVEQNPALERSLSGSGLLSNPLVIKGILTLVLSMVIYLVFSILGSLLYSALGGPRDEDIASRTRTNRFG